MQTYSYLKSPTMRLLAKQFDESGDVAEAIRLLILRVDDIIALQLVHDETLTEIDRIINQPDWKKRR
jgi:hypothetical protein